MADFFSALRVIAEQRILEAQERGDFDNLPGVGQPLPEEDLSGVPEDLRLAYRLLKNGGYLPEEVADRKEMSRLADLLETSSDEQTRLRSMQRLRVIMDKVGFGRHSALLQHDEYYSKVLGLLEREERIAHKA